MLQSKSCLFLSSFPGVAQSDWSSVVSNSRRVSTEVWGFGFYTLSIACWSTDRVVMWIWQEVTFKVDYVVPSINREFGTVIMGGQNVAHDVVADGWAKVR
jgi:hypothetical protein